MFFFCNAVFPFFVEDLPQETVSCSQRYSQKYSIQMSFVLILYYFCLCFISLVYILYHCPLSLFLVYSGISEISLP